MPVYRGPDGKILEIDMLRDSEVEKRQLVTVLYKERTMPVPPDAAHETVEVLLNQGADPNAVANAYNPPLHITARYNAYETVEVLLNQGADPNTRDNYGYTPLHIVARYNAYETAEVLLNQGADPNARDNYGSTPLQYAAKYNAPETAEMLLNQGADINARDDYGSTLLHIVAIYNAHETAEVLLNQGTDPNARDNHSYTPLHVAAVYNACEIAEMLLNQGADVNTRDKYGNTPLQYATGEAINTNEGNEAHPPLALPQGTCIQNFEFLSVLRQGIFGITYLGWNEALNIPVAIKEYIPYDSATRESDMSVVPQSAQGASDFQWGLERFLNEVRTLARFDHRHIIKVHHFFEAHGTAYIVMEYAEGETLSAYLAGKETLTEVELKAILYPILDGLEVVHGADFLHRDIKPDNIIIRDEDNSPVLLDFGVAVSIKNPSEEVEVEAIITPGYAPIEQYSTRGEDHGPWTDIYALGAVCYQALTGQRPEDAIERTSQDPLIPVSECSADRASVGFLSAIDRALQVHKEDRPQSIAEWRVALSEETPRP